MPEKPKEQQQLIDTDKGQLLMNLYMYQSANTEADNLVYYAMHTEYPSDLVNSNYTNKVPELFKNAINGAVGNVNGVLLSEKDIALNGYLGKEIEISYQNGSAIITMRQYLTVNKTYILQVICTEEKRKNASITFFSNLSN